ncbi:T9SS type A sorting domain-containing protein [Aquimarina longa]|uniref:T9SS type A sorting domain-containing protein n=1 Tax=Aquimarina longa TaxID=1080221 RepID=UPI0007842791|nr:T9SS type A sorting domain-containing protein [Aquimarina longa]
MKSKIIISIGLLLFGFYLYPQQSQPHPIDCRDTLDGAIDNISMKNCKGNISITTTHEDGLETTISSSIITTQGKITITPISGKKITILPYIINNNEPTEPKSRGTLIGGNTEDQPSDFYGEKLPNKKPTTRNNYYYPEESNKPKSLRNKITIFPNPVTTELTIQTNTSILGYKIFNSLGVPCSKGKIIPNNTLRVTKLPVGLYYIRLQTTSGVINKAFYKK